MIEAIRNAIKNVNHNKVYPDPNVLIKQGFDAEFILPLIEVFKSTPDYVYVYEMELVQELIGVSHLRLIYAIADHLKIPKGVGANYTGRGFAMQAVIEAIENELATENG
ncbi:MAG: hypothetical protein KJ846_06745 [Proteobacteria bacterium]|nr:hypothetical protein [Pseudomonadota bacterium]MBU1986910.1 hypothetical protein [Pseudomonadota bacterium]